MSDTLATLKNQTKRRIRQLRQTTGSGSDKEEDEGNVYGDNAIKDGLNAGRRQLVLSVRSAEAIWGVVESIFATALDTQQYKMDDAVLKVISVVYDVDSNGDRQSTSYEAINVKDRKGEERAIRGSMDNPSITNPKYRITNEGIMIMTSTDGTQTASKNILIEHVRELDQLSQDSDTSDLPDTLNDMTVEWAVHILTIDVRPDISQRAYSNFFQMAQVYNQRGF